jgi:hypothetical protein
LVHQLKLGARKDQSSPLVNTNIFSLKCSLLTVGVRELKTVNCGVESGVGELKTEINESIVAINELIDLMKTTNNVGDQ